MRIRTTIFFYLVCTIFLACSRQANKIEEQPIPRYALFVHAGDETAPSWPLIIYTNENDTSFHQYFRIPKYEQVTQYGFSLTDEKLARIKKYHVNDSIFNLVQDYLLKENTFKTNLMRGSYIDDYWVFLNTGDNSTIYYLTELNAEDCHYCKMNREIKNIIPDFGKRIK
jgi:hypothetical protein